MIVDLHAHLDFDVFKNKREEILKKIDYVINPGSDYESNYRILELIKKHKNVLGVLGVHPISELKISESKKKEIIELILKNKNKIKGIGEVGLDYHWDQTNKEKQKENFINWIFLANELKKPLIIHLRKPEAINDGLKILNKNANVPIILHCWSGNITQTKEVVDQGYLLSIATNCILNKKKYNKLIKIIPLNKIFCETDSPYLWKEFPNIPLNVIEVYKMISEIKEIDQKEVEKNVYSRFVKIFNL